MEPSTFEFNQKQKDLLQYMLMMSCHKTPHVWRFDQLIKQIENVVNNK